MPYSLVFASSKVSTSALKSSFFTASCKFTVPLSSTKSCKSNCHLEGSLRLKVQLFLPSARRSSQRLGASRYMVGITIFLLNKGSGLIENVKPLTSAILGEILAHSGFPKVISSAASRGHGIQPRQPASPLRDLCQVNERLPRTTKDRPVASLIRVLSHGFARFQSKVTKITTASAIIVRKLATLQINIFTGRDIFIIY